MPFSNLTECIKHFQEEIQRVTNNNIQSEATRKSLTSLSLIANTLLQVVGYFPCEQFVGISRGLLANANNGKTNLMTIYGEISTNDILPCITDDTTFQVNQIVLDFTKNVQQTANGQALLSTINSFLSTFFPMDYELDKLIVEIVETQILQYQRKLQENGWNLKFFDARSSDTEEFYDAETDVYPLSV